MSNILTPGLMPNSLNGIQTAFDAGTAGEKSTFQAAVSEKRGIFAAYGIAPSGSISAAGALILATPLPAVFLGGLWLYFRAGVATGSAAGMFWTVMSSPTAGIVYTSPGGAPLAGLGAYTGVTDEVTLWSVPSILAGKSVLVRYACSQNNSAGSKTTRMRLDGVLFSTVSATTTVGQVAAMTLQSLGGGLQCAAQSASSGATSFVSFLSVDDTSERVIYITGQLSSATDCLVLVHALVV